MLMIFYLYELLRNKTVHEFFSYGLMYLKYFDIVDKKYDTWFTILILRQGTGYLSCLCYLDIEQTNFRLNIFYSMLDMLVFL